MMAQSPLNSLVSVSGCLDTHLSYISWAIGRLERLCDVSVWTKRGESLDNAMEITRNFFNIIEQLSQGECEVGTPTGTIISTVSATSPNGFLPLNGTPYLVADYPDLALLVPDLVIGDYIQFPNMTGRTLIGAGDTTDDFGFISYPVMGTGGSRLHKITINEMPIHNHAPTGVSNSYLTGTAIGLGGGEGLGSGNSGSFNLTTGNRGGDIPHNNIPPFLAVYWHVKA